LLNCTFTAPSEDATAGQNQDLDFLLQLQTLFPLIEPQMGNRCGLQKLCLQASPDVNAGFAAFPGMNMLEPSIVSNEGLTRML
jgi:hypothetical protein